MAFDRDDDRRERLLDGGGLVRAGMTPEEAGALVGLPARMVEVYAGCSERVVFVPTPEMIETRAAEIRAGWSDGERRSRSSSRRQGEHVGGVDAAGHREYVSSDVGFRLVE